MASLVTGLLLVAPGGFAEPEAYKGRRAMDAAATPGAIRKDALTSGSASSYWIGEFRRRWKVERAANHRRALTIRRLRHLLNVRLTPQEAVCAVFGTYCGQALAVADCESDMYTGARNGQYLGMFQMGESERARYGHGPTAVEQAQAAYRYFRASGKDWSPWQCKP